MICGRCKIDWKKGKNVTVKTIRKKQKNKGGSLVVVSGNRNGLVRNVTEKKEGRLLKRAMLNKCV